jgi:predicted RND superfamily exporter protein
MGYQTQFVKIAYRFVKVLPETDQASIDFDKVNEDFGSSSNGVIVAIETGENNEFFKGDHLSAWKNLIDSLESIEGINSAFSITEAFNIGVNDSLKELKLIPLIDSNVAISSQGGTLQNSLDRLPFYQGLLFTEDRSVFMIMVRIQEDLVFSKKVTGILKEVTEKVHAYEAETGSKAHLSGLPYILFANAKKMTKEIQVFIVLTLLVTATILYLFLKSFRATFFSLIVVVLGVLTTFGLMGLLDVQLTIVLTLIPPLVIVISVPNCIYLINKYHAEYKVHGNKVLALQRVVRKIGYVTLLTNVTTALGFAAFILTDSITLVDFGVITSVNIIIIFILSITIIPITYSYSRPPKERHYKHLDKKWVRGLITNLEHMVQYHRNWVYVITLAVVVIGIYGVSQMETTGKLSDDFSKKDPVYMDLKFLEKSFGGIVPLDIIIDTKKENGVQKASTLNKIEELKNQLKDEEILSSPLSIVEFVKFANQGLLGGAPEKYALPTRQERQFLLSYLPKKGNSDMLRSIVDSNQQRARIIYQVADIDSPEMKEFYNRLQVRVDSIFDPERYDVTITGASVKFMKGTKYLVENLILSLALAIVVISIIMAFLFGSAKMVFISIVPNLIPLLLTGGIMGLVGIPLKPSTILVFSIAFGISVDDTIHFLAKYRQELRANNWDIKKSVIIAIRETGVSMFYTSIVLLFGFSILMASEFGGSQALGFLVGITLFFAMLSNLVVLPSFLMSLDKWVNAKNFSATIISEEIHAEEEEKILEEKE